MIAIIDYEAGNICSVQNALERLGASYELTSDPELIRKADKVILPGVGNAAEAMASLRRSRLDSVIRTLRQPLLGICVGLQVLCRGSEEGPTEGLGIFDTFVKRFPNYMAEGNSCSAKKNADASQKSSPTDNAEEVAKVPHMGWNCIGNLESKLFKDLPGGSFVYFVHSYYPELCPDTIATCRHGDTLFSAALRWENFYGTQFHPEKSGEVGAAILKNFLAL
jgi:glutamine amidotransferase